MGLVKQLPGESQVETFWDNGGALINLLMGNTVGTLFFANSVEHGERRRD